jgi:pyruvate,water dikinase
VARGPVTVLRRLEDVATVAPGAILVLRHGNPGWAPAFLTAAGLVVEQSGLLSHTSVIARERGLPAVINVERATEILRDGDEVEVDGRAGFVTVLDRRG